MATTSVTTSGVSTSTAVSVNQLTTSPPYSIGVEVTGTVTYTLQVQINTSVWFPIVIGATASAFHVVEGPISAVRLDQTVGAGSTVTTVTTVTGK